MACVALLESSESMFSLSTWRKAQTLAIGAMLAPGKRTVTSALGVMGMRDRKDSRFTITFSTALAGLH